jgi:hypothetical protein
MNPDKNPLPGIEVYEVIAAIVGVGLIAWLIWRAVSSS